MRRRTRLSVTSLEDRTTPATASYAAGTLTLSAATADSIAVSLKQYGANTIPGYLLVQVGGSIAFQSAANQPVKNLVVKPAAGAVSFGVDIGQDVVLSSLNVTGASGSTGVTLSPTAKVTGNFTFTGTGAGEDGIALLNGSAVGGNVSLDLKDGASLVNLAGGVIGGSLSITGGKDADEVKLFEGDQVTVGGSVTFNLGDGKNEVHGVKQDTLWVGKNFTYTGGAGDDTFNLAMFNDYLHVGGNLSASFGGVTTLQNSWVTHTLEVGGTATFTGGSGQDSVFLWGNNTIGGGLTYTGGDGENFLNTGGQDYKTVIGGSLQYTGGLGTDTVRLDDLQVGQNATVALGAGPMGKAQKVLIGTQQGDPVQVGGKLTLTSGDTDDEFKVYFAQTGAGLAVNPGGGADTVYVDDANVSGAASIDLGAGTNTLTLDGQADNGNGDLLDGNSFFKTGLTILGGAGDDTATIPPKTWVGGGLTVDLKGGKNALNLAGGTVGGDFKYTGGAGDDTITLAADGDVKVGGAFSVTPGDGMNKVDGGGAHKVIVGKTFTYTGGANYDAVYLTNKKTDLHVAGDVVVTFGGAGPMQTNTWGTDDLWVGGNATFTGGGGGDGVLFGGQTHISGSLTMTGGEGQNYLNVESNFGGATDVGLGLQYTGGTGDDDVYLDALTVGTNVNVAVGAGPDIQQVTLGVFNEAPVVVNGNVTVTAGEATAQVTILRTLIGGDLSVTTGGQSDHVWMDDSDVAGSATFNLGGGVDYLDVETLPSMNQKPLPGEVHFGGNLTVNAGGGDDTVNLNDSLGSHVTVGGNVALAGGLGSDKFLHNPALNLYLGTATEDFELGETF